jgi:signal transduction histidine kinase
MATTHGADNAVRPSRHAQGTRRFPIRAKLAAALAIPLVAMGAITLAEVVSVASDAREVRDQTKLATATVGPGGLITALQDERNWAAGAMVGVESQLDMTVSSFDEAYTATDEALEEFDAEIESLGDVAVAAYGPVLDELANLPELRAEVGDIYASTPHTFDSIGEATVVFDDYTALIEPFFGAMSRLSVSIDDPELRQGAALAETTARMLEVMPQLANAMALPGTVPTAPGDTVGINSTDEITRLAELQSAFREHATDMAAAQGPYAAVADEYYNEEYTQTIDDLMTQAIETGDFDLDQLLGGLEISLDQAYIGYRDALADTIETRADELNDQAASRQRTWALVLGVTFVGAIALTVLASVSITRPLHSLTDQAKEMADRRLPNAVKDILSTPLGEDVTMPTVPPVRVKTRDEVADVAEALNTVQDSALDLAIEQAVLRRNIADSFVNLGRRNQNLLGRQLDFITELESNETDPDSLGSLFRLDHLATRMRRNAESLLVLAGIEPPRQWAAPLQLADIIRAALSEVEDYQRVTVRGVEPATIVGSAAADIAHLLAELIENALHFSPPDRTVDVKGRRGAGGLPDGDGYRLAVIDAGLGMAAGDIDAANRRLAGVESFTVAPSKYLGHYVAGNLAARHGITVALHHAAGGGVMATVDLPPDLLTSGGDRQVELRTAATPPPLAPAPPARADWEAPSRPAAPGFPTATQLATMERFSPGAPLPERTGPPDAPALPRLPSRPGASTPPPVVDAPAAAPSPSGPPLTRRTRGAQLPTTSLQSVNRSRGPQDQGRSGGAAPPPPPMPAPAPAPGPTPAPGPAASAATSAAADLYGFLTNFTAGVRRGLDASGPNGQGGA